MISKACINALLNLRAGRPLRGRVSRAMLEQAGLIRCAASMSAPHGRKDLWVLTDTGRAAVAEVKS